MKSATRTARPVGVSADNLPKGAAPARYLLLR